MKRIIVSVSNDLVTDQRVARICSTLKELDYEILLIGRKKRSLTDLKKLNRAYKVKRLRLLFNKGILFYAEFNFRLFFLLLFSKKDLLYSNDADTLIPNYLVAKIQGKELIFDSHELFSEVPEITNKKFVKSIWKGIEDRIIPKLKNVITVSDSIKKHYEEAYSINAEVVRNLPFTREITKDSFSFSTKGKKIILYQGAVNIGRGLELMIDTIKLLDSFILIIIGSGDVIYDLEQKVLKEGLENKVKFVGKILPTDLKKLTPNAHIGLSLEEDLGLNYRYALPNKLFDYIQAEIPVIVSDLPEMKKLVQSYKVGEILFDRTPKSLAKKILQVLENDYALNLQKAKKELNWENEKQHISSIFKNLM